MDSKTPTPQILPADHDWSGHEKVVDLDAIQADERAETSRQKRHRKGKGRGSRAKDVKRTRKTWCDNHQTNHTEKWCPTHEKWEQIR